MQAGYFTDEENNMSSILTSVKQDSCSKMVVSLIQDDMEKRSREHFSSVFDPLEITECPRRLIYRSLRHDQDFPYFDYVNFSTQSFVAQKWIDYFDKSKKIVLKASKYYVSDCKFNIGGLVDAVISVKDEIIVVKIRSVNDEDFQKIQKKGALKKDVIASIVQLWLMEIEDGLLIYENKNDQRYEIFHVEQHKPILESVKQKCMSLYKNLAIGQVPCRPYKTKNSKECGLCEFQTSCWKEQ